MFCVRIHLPMNEEALMGSKVLLSSIKSKLTLLIYGSTWMCMKGRNFGFTQMEKVTLANPRFLVINSIKVAAGENVNFTCVLCTLLWRPERQLPFSFSRRNDKIKESKIESVMMKSRRQRRSFEQTRILLVVGWCYAWKLKLTYWHFGKKIDSLLCLNRYVP